METHLKETNTQSEAPNTGYHCITEIPHVIQSHHWDCGVACASMLLRFVDPEREVKNHTFDDERKELGIPESVWTVDLAHLFGHFKVKNLFCTVTLGVDPTYEEVEFYTRKEHFGVNFTAEEQRINDKFATAAEKGINVQKRSVSREELIEKLSRDVPAIVLIDANIQRCEWCEQDLQNVNMCCLPSKRDYQGHFVVLCGYDIPKQQFLYKNPSFVDDLCSCSFDNFDEARRSHGTDEDILFIMR